MNIAAIFAGPSLYGSSYVDRYAHVLRPPVQDGELLPVATELGAGAVVLIIDGYFGAGQALTLTEIREAIGLGIRLYGATSTGALRAAETAAIGMRGIGGIFADYRDGRCVSDEEVCLVHDSDNRPLTVPVVNLRALCRLLRERDVPAEQVRAFFAAAKAIHYTARSVTGLSASGQDTLAEPGRRALADLLRPQAQGAWNAKRRDAEQAIDALAGSVTEPTDPVVPVPAVPDLLLRDAARAPA
jgi:hypothetical protein